MNTKRSDTSLSKRLLILLVTVGMAFHLSGCAMGGSSDEEASGGDETFADESSADFEDEGGEEVAEGEEGEEPAEGEEGAEEGTEVADGEEGAEGGDEELDGELAESGEETGGDDMALEDEGGEDVAAAGDDDELSLDDEEGLPEDVANNAAPADPGAPIEEPATAPTDAPVFAETPTEGSEGTDVATTEAPSEPTSWVPVKKVRTEAFMAGSTNLNRVYLGRSGDTPGSVAEKVYGDKGRQKDLKKWNTFLSRGVKTGDKIYYASPTNPTDNNMLTYYEDVGIPAQNYVSRDGDNIREVSKTLLGSADSWKEVWATNPDVESKGDIAAGLNIRYWPDGGAPAPILANNNNPSDPTMPPGGTDPLTQPGVDPLNQPQDPTTMPQDPTTIVQQPVNPGMDPLAQPTSTPASDPGGAIGMTDPQPPPPSDPPPVDPAPADPTPGVANQGNQAANDPLTGSTEEADQMMTMGLAGIVLLAAGAVFFLMRRNRSRKVDLTQTTQVG